MAVSAISTNDMPIMTIGSSPADVQRSNNDQLANGVSNIGAGIFPNMGGMANLQLRRAQMQQIQMKLQLQQQYQAELAQSFQRGPDGNITVGPDGKPVVDPVHFARANELRLALDTSADPMQAVYASRGIMDEAHAKGNAFQSLPTATQQTAVGPAPIHQAPGQGIYWAPGDIRNPANNAPALPAKGGPIMPPSGGQGGQGVQTQAGNPNVTVGRKIMDPAQTKKLLDELQGVQSMDAAYAATQKTPQAFGRGEGILASLALGIGQNAMSPDVRTARAAVANESIEKAEDLFKARQTESEIARLGSIRGGNYDNAESIQNKLGVAKDLGVRDLANQNAALSQEFQVTPLIQVYLDNLKKNGYQPTTPGVTVPGFGVNDASNPPAQPDVQQQPNPQAATQSATQPDAQSNTLPPPQQRQIGMPHPGNPSYVWGGDDNGNLSWIPSQSLTQSVPGSPSENTPQSPAAVVQSPTSNNAYPATPGAP